MNERSDRLMKALGDIGADLIAKAAPVFPEAPDTSEHGNIIAVTPYEPEIQLTKRDIRIYWITRALGMAAVLALVVGGGVWLLKNWDKIAVRDPDRPGVVTTVSENDPTPSSEHSELYTPTDLTYALEDKTVHVTGYEFDRLWCKLYVDITYLYGIPESGCDFDVRIKGNKDKGETSHRFDKISEKGNTISYTAEVFDLKSAKYFSEIVFSEWDGSSSFTVPVTYQGKIPTADLEINMPIQTATGRAVTLETVSVCSYMFGFVYQGGNNDYLSDIGKYRVIMKNGEEIPVICRRYTYDDSGRGFAQVLVGDVYSDPDMRINDRIINADDIAEIYVNNFCVYGLHQYEINISDSNYSFSDEVFGIFEDVFYGEWEPAEGNNADHNIVLTYSKDLFTFENWVYPFGIIENDEAYVMPYMDSGAAECLIIRKDDPRVLYKGWWNRTDSSDYYTEPTETFTVDPGTGKYKRINDEPYDRELHTGEIGVWGLHKLICGGEQSTIRPRFETETYYTIPGGFYGGGYSVPGGFEGKGYFTDENGTEWVISGTKALGASKVYYLGGDGITSLTLGIRYYEKAAYETYINEHINDAAYEPKEQYFAVSFTVDENGICRTTYRPLEEVYEEAKTKTYTGATPDYYEGLLPELELKDVLRVGESLSFQSAVVALRAPDGEIKASCPLASGMVGLNGGYSCTAVREPLVMLFNLENRRILIAVGLPLWESEFDRSYLSSFYLYDGEPVLRRVETEGDYLEVVVKDSTGISQGEDGNIYCTQPDGLRLQYHIGENGHAALSPSQYN